MTGEMMALTAAVMWGFGATFFGMAGRRSDPVLVNILRLPLGMVLLGAAWFITSHQWWPDGVTPSAHLWLGLSGTIGLALGDSFLFYAITIIGPRRALMVLAATPAFAAISAWLMLGETLDAQALLGMAIILGGILVATAFKDSGGGEFRDLPRATLRKGLSAALVCAVCSGVGNTFAKSGMTASGVDLSPLAATLVRMMWATVAISALAWWRRDTFQFLPRIRAPRVAWPLFGGLMLGPFIGMWFAISAIKMTDTGIATVLMNTVPLTVLLPSWLFHRDPPSRAALAGIVLALGGAVVLFLR
jgi:drug/metabolite transporter (DMT)-like permease